LITVLLAISLLLHVSPTSTIMNTLLQHANQGTSRSLSYKQNVLCLSGSEHFVSCNNLNAQSKSKQNRGINLLAQTGGSCKGKTGGNTAGSGDNVNTQSKK
jgi:hypothetical protein